MDAITEVFLEAWDDAQQARQKCDIRVAELERQGFHCSIGLFYNILTGKRIYLLEATVPTSPVSETPLESRPKHIEQRPSVSRPKRTKTSRPASFEKR